MKALQYLRRMLVMAVMSLCLTFAVTPEVDAHAAAAQPVAQAAEAAGEEEETFFFFIMGGGLLIILSVVAATVGSVSAIIGVVAQDESEG